MPDPEQSVPEILLGTRRLVALSTSGRRNLRSRSEDQRCVFSFLYHSNVQGLENVLVKYGYLSNHREFRLLVLA